MESMCELQGERLVAERSRLHPRARALAECAHSIDRRVNHICRARRICNGLTELAEIGGNVLRIADPAMSANFCVLGGRPAGLANT